MTESAEAYALAEHLELQRAGWWDEAIARFVRFHLYGESQGLTDAQLTRAAVRSLGHEHDRERVEACLARLRAAQVIYTSEDRNYLHESERDLMREDEATIRALESRVENLFSQTVGSLKYQVTDTPDWPRFKSELLLPVVRELGARSVGLLNGQVANQQTRAYQTFMDKFAEEDQGRLREQVDLFIDPDNPAVRQYLLGLLTQYMLVSSSGLEHSTLQSLNAEHPAANEFRLILDTNVLFSLLGLHQNPSNDSADTFVRLRQATAEYCRLILLVLPETLVEAREALEGAKLVAPRGQMTTALTAAGADHVPVSGLVGKFMTTAAAMERPLSAAAYFDPYITGLETILAEMDIAVASDPTDHIKQRKSYKDAVSNWQSFEYDKVNGRSRAKIEHDALALEFVGAKRGTPPPSTFAGSTWWFMTIDLRLQHQERSGLLGRRAVPRSITPAEMAQLLRFYVPRSEELDRALVGAIKLPFSFYKYDKGVEKVSLAILDAISGYAAVESLSESAVRRLLADEALREAATDSSRGEWDAGEPVKAAIDRIASQDETRIKELEEQVEALRRAAEESSQRQAPSTQRRAEKVSRVIAERDKLRSELSGMREALAASEAEKEELRNLGSRISELEGHIDGDSRLKSLNRSRIFSTVGILVVATGITLTFFTVSSSASRVALSTLVVLVVSPLIAALQRHFGDSLSYQSRFWQWAAGSAISWMGSGAAAAVLAFIANSYLEK